MSIVADNFIESAKVLIQGNLEVDHRNAASRAYYAIYHQASPFAEDLDPPKNKATGTHSYLAGQFIDSPASKVKAVGYMIKQCLSIRHRADYDLAKDFNKVDAESVILYYDRIVEKLKELE